VVGAQTLGAGAGQYPTYPVEKLPPHTLPSTPVPKGLSIATVAGDAARGAQLYRTGACIGCHYIEGVSPGRIGPSLTHVGSRTTIGAGLYPNDARHLALWIKNAPAMKPGSLMPAFGKSAQVPAGYNDQQIADIAAYLLSLK
jgi:cytochrome c oxidase subunit 2